MPNCLKINVKECKLVQELLHVGFIYQLILFVNLIFTLYKEVIKFNIPF